MRLAVILILAIFLIYGCTEQKVVVELDNKKPRAAALKDITLPEGFNIDIFASNLGKGLFASPGPSPGPRFMEFYNDVLFVSIPNKGIVVALPDYNKDGEADNTIKVIESLNNPHGIAFKDGYIYVAGEDILLRAKMNEDLTANASTIEDITGLPQGGHWTRTIRIHNESIYVGIGSSCNLCIENDESRGSIVRCNDNGNCRIFASGIRNAVGFVFHPLTNDIYATENSRDYLGDDLPPDEINIIKEDRHYGWPYCYGKNIQDPAYNNGCEFRTPSFVDLQAHSAPLGLAFNLGGNFPQDYKGDLFVAYHGSWNRKEKTGYKVVRIDMDTKNVHDFATGWLKGNSVSGRPVDIIFDKNGVMYVSDDFSGRIYRIWYG